MEKARCDVCGQEFSKPSAMMSHKRWKHEGRHPGGSMSSDVRAELAEYRALKADVVALQSQLSGVVRNLAHAQPVASPSGAVKLGEKASGGVGLGWLLVVGLVGAALWANFTDEGRETLAEGDLLKQEIASRRRSIMP